MFDTLMLLPNCLLDIDYLLKITNFIFIGHFHTYNLVVLNLYFV